MAAGVVVLAGSVTWWRQDLLLLGLALVLLPLASLLAVGLTHPRLTVTRSLAPDTVAAGEETGVAVTLTNTGGAAPGILGWRDLTSEGIGAHTREQLPVAAAGFAAAEGSVVLRHTVRTARRGVYTVGPVVIVTGDPFGLARRERELGPTARLTVTPLVDPITVDDLGAAGGDGSEREVLRRANPGADEVIAREYRTGDPLRRVHWRATARLGELMVRQEEQHSDPEAWILFDTYAVHAAQHTPVAHADPQFERAVRLVATLGSTLLGLGYQVRIVETGRPQLGRFSSERAGQSNAGGGAHDGRGVAAFDRSGGTRALLAGLAAVTQRQQPNEWLATALLGGLRRAGASAPAFAVLQADAVAVLQADAELYRNPLGEVPLLSGRATAFLPGAAVRAGEHLESAGWRVTAYPRIGGRRG